MPSPTATIRPTSADTRLASKSLSRSLITSEISRVLMPIFVLVLLGSRQPAAQLLQPGGDARVDDVVPVLQLHPTEDARVDHDAHAYVFLESFRKLSRDAFPVGRLEGDRGRHRRVDAPRRLVGQTMKLFLDRRRFADATRLD